MSHLHANMDAIITDTNLLRKTVDKFPGLTWVEGKKDFFWYYSNAKGEENQFGKCEHVIKVKDCDYEIGVFKRKDGKGWSLVWDPHRYAVGAAIGHNAEALMTAYEKECFYDYADRNGYIVEETVDADGMINMALLCN
jgi:hypothetical protein